MLGPNERTDRAAPQIVPWPGPRSWPLPTVWPLPWREEEGARVRVMERFVEQLYRIFLFDLALFIRQFFKRFRKAHFF